MLAEAVKHGNPDLLQILRQNEQEYSLLSNNCALFRV